MTVGLLWLMQQLLIADDVESTPPHDDPFGVTMVKLPNDPPPPTDEVAPLPPLPKPVKTPTNASATWVETHTIDVISKLGPAIGGSPINDGPIPEPDLVDDRPLIPLVRVAASYPSAARNAGREGYVDLRFLVTATGQPADIEVVYASHPIFRNAALRAVARFKYKPRVHNGEAVAVNGVETRIRFKMED